MAGMSIQHTLKRLTKTLWQALWRGRRIPVYAGLLATSLILMLFNARWPLLRAVMERLDNVVYDQRFSLTLPDSFANEHNIVIVDYDQKSLEREGQWPWSRFKIGKLVEALAGYGVLVVGFDVTFPEYERNLARELQNRIELDPGYAERIADLLPSLQEQVGQEHDLDGDRLFAESLQTMDVVLGFSFRPSESIRTGVLPEPLFEIDPRQAAAISLLTMRGYEGNIDVLQEAASGGGFFDTLPDVDGIIRSSPLVMQFENRVYPSLALDMARLFWFEDSFRADIQSDATGLRQELQGIFMNSVRIPTNELGEVLVPYVGPARSYPYISATDVLRGTLTPEQEEQLFNSLVLVGTTATGLYDLRATPVQAVYPGVEIHANILNAILSSSPVMEFGAEAAQGEGLLTAIRRSAASPFPSRPDWESGVTRAAIVVIGLVLSFVYPCLGAVALGVSSLLLLFGLTLFNFFLWERYNLDFSLVILLILVVLITAINMTYGFLKEGLTRKTLKGMFDQYVPPAHIDAMLNDPDRYNFEGESKELSVLFSDIRGFTTISEQLSASDLKRMLNDFFTPITGIIFEHHGTIDKYVGDMVMAFWGAPLDDPRHREHAVAAALRMLDKVAELKQEFLARGLPEINLGVGINTGMMSVGDMGSTYRRSYTVLGDAVNLGSRLEGLTKFYGVKLLIGEQTHDSLQGFLCRLVDKVQVKGKEEGIRMYEPLCALDAATPEQVALVERFHAAYALYLARDWEGADRELAALQEEDPDTALYGIYRERIEEFRTTPLLEGWDGTYRHTSK